MHCLPGVRHLEKLQILMRSFVIRMQNVPPRYQMKHIDSSFTDHTGIAFNRLHIDIYVSPESLCLTSQVPEQ